MTLFRHAAGGTNPGGIDRVYGADWDLLVDYITKARIITGNYTLTESDRLLLCNTNSGAIVVTLPAVSTMSGKHFIIIKTHANNTVTINRTGSDTINGQTSYVLSSVYETLHITNDAVLTWLAVHDAQLYQKVSQKGAANGYASLDSSGFVPTAQLPSSVLYNNQDNALGAHYLEFTEITDPSTPSSNNARLYLDNSDEHLKVRKASGSIVDLEATGGGGGGTDPSVVWVGTHGAEGDGTTDDTSAIQAAIDAAGTGGYVVFGNGLSGGHNYKITTRLDVAYNEITLDGRGATVTAAAGTWSANFGMFGITGAEKNHINIRNFILDLGGQNCYGVTNMEMVDPAPQPDVKLKFSLFENLNMNNNKAGFSYIRLRDVENNCQVLHCELDNLKSSTANPTAALHVDMNTHIGGNLVVIGNKISMNGSGAKSDTFVNEGAAHDQGVGILIDIQGDSFNRTHIAYNHIFVNNNHWNAVGIKYTMPSSQSGGTHNNRTHIVTGNGVEDAKYALYIEGDNVGSSAGYSGMMVFGNGFENKNDTTNGNEETGVEIIHIGAVVVADIFDNVLYCQPGDNFSQTGISVASTNGVRVHDNLIVKKGTGAAAVTYIGGSAVNNANTLISGNTGFITENSGSGSIAGGSTNSGNIAHGLSYTPTADEITITMNNNPTNDPGHIWVSNIGSTNFQVNCRTSPGSSATFNWSIRRLDKPAP